MLIYDDNNNNNENEFKNGKQDGIKSKKKQNAEIEKVNYKIQKWEILIMEN